MEIRKSSRDIDKEVSFEVARAILEGFEDLPIENSLEYLNGITAATAKLTEIVKSNVNEMSEKDGLEKLVLSWLSATDSLTGLRFSKFIKID